MTFVAGLAIIIAGWIIQVYLTLAKKDRQLSPAFLVVYAIGAAVLAGGNFLGKDTTTGTLNIITVVLAATLAVTLTLWKKIV